MLKHKAGFLFICKIIICRVHVCLCMLWIAYQPWSKEHSQQSQAGSHHYEEQKHNERMLLAHTVVGFIKPVRGSFPPFFTRYLCPVKKVPLSPHCFLPRRSWSREGWKRGRETRRGGGGYCWGISSFHYSRRASAVLFCSCAVVPVGDPGVRTPELQFVLRFFLCPFS